MLRVKSMFAALVGLLLLIGAADSQNWNVTFEPSTITVEMEQTVTVKFSAPIPDIQSSDITIAAHSSDVNLATVNTPAFVNTSDVQNGFWNSSLDVTGVFLGSVDVTLSLTYNNETSTSDRLAVTVIREERLIDSIFVASVAILVSLIYINFGCAMDWPTCKKSLKRPIGPAIGFVTQFLYMPLISYFLGIVLFPDSPEMQIGMFFTGVSPGGGASNIWTVLLGGNLNLSVTMTTISSIAAFGMMPLWIFTLGRRIFDRGNLGVPYTRIATFVVGLVVPLSLGFLSQKKLPKFAKLMVRILKPFSSMLIIFIIVFAIATNLYLFQLFSWQIVVAGIGLPWLGYTFGLLTALAFRQPFPDVTAISVETGIQNTGIAIFLLRFSLPQPTADLTTVAPVSCAIMTPIPLTILWIIKTILDHRKKKLAASSEKFQDIAEPVPTITNSSSPDGV